jgi:putative colanic acid biosynthesis UDP-glucose lipid carrier transferase
LDGHDSRHALYESPHFKELGFIQQYGAALVRLTFLVDSLILYCQLYVATHGLGIAWEQRYVTLALLCIIVFGVVTSFRHLYRSWRLIRLRHEINEIFVLLTVSFVAVWIVLQIGTDWAGDARYRLLIEFWYGLSIVGIVASRLVMRLFLRYYRAGGHDHRSAAFIGATEATERLLRIFREHPWMGIDVIGTYDDEPIAASGTEPPVQLAGTVEDLLDLARKDRVGAIYITLPMHAEQRIKSIIDRFADTTVSIHYCPPLFGFGLMNARWDDVYGYPVVSIVASPFDGYKRYLKRIEDLVLSLIALPFLLVPIAIIAVAVKLTSPGPAFYLQTRYGLGGRPFKIWKFRSMYQTDSDQEFVQARKNDSRITPLGAVLRRTSLDELPQFFNVLRGEMSVVGPRPAPVKYNEDHRRVIYRYMLRHKIKPGITGLAQVNGSRGETESLEKTELRTSYDLEYMNNWSVWLDLTILLRTCLIVLRDFLPTGPLFVRNRRT